jgi:predicted DNA-binding ribbon-helix-helix protein
MQCAGSSRTVPGSTGVIRPVALPAGFLTPANPPHTSVLTARPIIGRTVAIAFKYIGGDIVKVEEIHIGPITTPDYPDPTESPRTIRDDYGFYGFDTVSLEDATWNALCEIARERGCTVDELCSDIELNFSPGEPFATAARRYVVRYLAEIPDNIELPADFRVLREPAVRRRVQ